MKLVILGLMFVSMLEPMAGDTDQKYLERQYRVYNQQYFDNKLPEPKIDTRLNNLYEAQTVCNTDGNNCSISFNLHYVAARRTAQGTLLHEMCHIKTWTKHLNSSLLPPSADSEFYHDKSWRGCMLQLDAQGVFRVINIDFYREE